MASEKYLNRGDAPFGDRVWEEIDKVAVESARGLLTGRRLLHTISLDGLGLKTLPLRDTPVSGRTVEGVTVTSSCTIPVAMIQSEFSLSVRDIAAFEESGVPLDVNQVVKAALAVARQEEQLIFEGFPPLTTVGLLNTPGARSVKLRPWSQPGDAAADIINAVTELDHAGFPGPYSLALAPASYNHLFQLYPQSELTELEHVRQIVTDLVVKAPAIPGGGVVVDTSGPYASIVLGQDMATSFTGPGPARYEFAVIESLALWVQVPEAICVLK
jgi:uncharacterized linocin/CFP29 family protein